MITSQPLRVLALLEASSISGTARAVLEMACEAKMDRSAKPEVQILVGIFVRGNQNTDNGLTDVLRKMQIPYVFIREKGRFDKSVIPQIRDLLKLHQAHVVWTNSVKSHFLVYLANVKNLCNWVAFHHGYTSTDLKMLIYNQLDRISLRHADQVLTVCLPLAAQMLARGVQEHRIHVQHMPIRPFRISHRDSSDLRTELHLDSDAKVILSVGRQSHEKAHADLITAFAKLCQKTQKETNSNSLRLVLVGDGPERANLQKHAANCGLRDRVLFTGHRDDARRFYGIANVFAIPSYAEGTPNVLLEAMAAGVPCVATRVGGIPELATDGLNALLVPSANPAALAEALERILESPALANQLSTAANRVVEAHPPRTYFENLRQVFLDALTGESLALTGSNPAALAMSSHPKG